jgi:hypothetical protein
MLWEEKELNLRQTSYWVYSSTRYTNKRDLPLAKRENWILILNAW